MKHALISGLVHPAPVGNTEILPDDGIPVLGRGWLALLPYASSSKDTTLLSCDDIRRHVERLGETWMSV